MFLHRPRDNSPQQSLALDDMGDLTTSSPFADTILHPFLEPYIIDDSAQSYQAENGNNTTSFEVTLFVTILLSIAIILLGTVAVLWATEVLKEKARVKECARQQARLQYLLQLKKKEDDEKRMMEEKARELFEKMNSVTPNGGSQETLVSKSDEEKDITFPPHEEIDFQNEILSAVHFPEMFPDSPASVLNVEMTLDGENTEKTSHHLTTDNGASGIVSDAPSASRKSSSLFGSLSMKPKVE